MTLKIDEKSFRNTISKILLILTVYLIGISALFYYLHSMVSAPVCSCSISLTWIVALLTSSGVIVGIIVYYYLKDVFEEEREEIQEEIHDTLRFLDREERKIVEDIIQNPGESQKEIAENTGLDKVTVSRKLKALEKQKIVSRHENGMSKKVVLEEPFNKLFEAE